jgi:flavin reductase (DIM6/NTAB) family NADH-FMN oxidoreductase RutF
MNKERVSPALGKIASGLYITTALDNDSPVGMLCSFVEQAGFEPPTISIALGRDRPLKGLLESGATFGLNILCKDNGALVKSFSRFDGSDPFAGHTLVENEFGVPQFADAWAFLACKPLGSMAAGDHVLFIAEVLDGIRQREKQEPMIRIRQNGFSY